MSGFDTSQPVTDEAVLRDDDEGTEQAKQKKAEPPRDAEAVPPEELDDATPGPR
jgi:hypothetical protein